jgi:hypothetical protein
VIGVLTGHPRRDVRAWLVELDERNVALARQAAGLHGVEVLQADAGITDACAGAVPAQVVVACGIFGNIAGSGIQATVAALPSLCAPGALVLWTRHRSPPDLTPAIRSWFGEAGFREEAFDTSHDGFMSVGAHRLTGEPAALVPGRGPQEILRSGDPELVRQEAWVHLAAHHCLTRLIRRLADGEGTDPDRISFVKVLKHVRRSVIRQTAQASAQVRQFMAMLAAKAGRKLDNGARRLREADRCLKRPASKYSFRKAGQVRRPTRRVAAKVLTLHRDNS